MNTVGSDFDVGAFIHISTASGSLVGRRRGAVIAFKGIPYAKPPVGALRWRPPQRAPRWQGVRPALDLGPAPIQELPPRSSLLYRLNNDDSRALVMSEDCLYLNVWSPEPSPGTNLPVLVWIHGGANKTGHGGQDLFDGSRLAARGIVVVTVNMRLGALGFLALPELAAEDSKGASGNYGAQDVVAALDWVQDNIASFGGDVTRVTIAGNSVGAATVTHLMAAPAARGLFRAALGQSLSGIFRPELRMATQAEAAERGRTAVSSLGRSIEQLRDLPATAFVPIASQGIIVDGRLLSEDTTDVFIAGRQARIPLLVGWNADEGSLYASPSAVDDLKLELHSEQAQSMLKQVYPYAYDKDGHGDRRALVGDRRFVYPVWRWARTHAETTGCPTWVYKFEHLPPLPDELPPPPDGGAGYGTFHTAELPYAWDNLGVRPWAWSDSDHVMAKNLADTWGRFVATGDPNGNGLPKWDQFDSSHEHHLMVFGTTTKPGFASRREAFDIFDSMYFRTKQ
ncbi:carboxylesterase/lipase family protein [Noviherbaspirillum saxi]|uniref:Carboxylesterase family protein n=1 Tax=Noviherbaspirillum saxi TaxID=2320863 RepID=A0A3A3FM71_9BURK|nr:carboxylesterase family protein [Noviherbaspirillum saxi]RJF95585.1 carboxylesterase family protein [Noviherbaspirillum saxi]